MDTWLWILATLMTFPFAYVLQFTSATHSLGKELSDTGSKRGFQDAISPPWETNLGLAVYFILILIVGLMWWEAGFLSAIGCAALIFFGTVFAKLVVPRIDGEHYRKLIIGSMMSRYANYVRDGDKLRAEAMQQLLAKAGFDPERIFKS